MELRHDKHADRYREANPTTLLASRVTVGELREWLSQWPDNTVVFGPDWFNDSVSEEINIEYNENEQRLYIKG